MIDYGQSGKEQKALFSSYMSTVLCCNASFPFQSPSSRSCEEGRSVDHSSMRVCGEKSGSTRVQLGPRCEKRSEPLGELAGVTR